MPYDLLTHERNSAFVRSVEHFYTQLPDVPLAKEVAGSILDALRACKCRASLAAQEGEITSILYAASAAKQFPPADATLTGFGRHLWTLVVMNIRMGEAIPELIPL